MIRISSRWDCRLTHLPGKELFEQNYFASRVDSRLAGRDGRDEKVAGREPGAGVVVQLAEKLFSSNERGLFELGLYADEMGMGSHNSSAAHVNGLRVRGLVPP